MVVLEQPTEAFATLCWPCPLTALANHRQEQHVALALMIPFAMVMVHVLVERMPEGGFTKQNQPRQGFVFDRSDPPLRVRIQIR